MKINEYLQNLRMGQKKSLKDVVEQLNWPISKLSKIESGQQNVLVEEVEMLGAVYGKSTAEIFLELRSVGSKTPNMIKNQVTGLPNLSVLFDNVLQDYHQAIQQPFKGSSYNKLLNSTLPQTLQSTSKLDTLKYIVTGSAGKGQYAEVPWLAVFNSKVTNTATKGIYIVYLFAHDMSGVYLSLNQGFTYFEEKYKATAGIEEIKKAADCIRKECHLINDKFTLNEIDLKATGKLAKGYMAGHITGKYYPVNAIPNTNELISDLYDLIKVYEEIIDIIGKRSIEEFYNYIMSKAHNYLLNEEEYLELVDKYRNSLEKIQEVVTGIKLPIPKSPLIIEGSGGFKYPRKPRIAANALRMSGYKCEFDHDHITFSRRSDGTQYTEPHHLIPLSAYDDFKYSLDVEGNIVSLCSHCHNLLHYGADFESILRKIYNERKDILKQVGLEISFEQLKKYYK